MELVVLSGKGGTGKTTIAIALSELAQDVIRIDCDVDAPNLYLFYQGKDIEKKEFMGARKAVIDESLCIKCGKCEAICRFDAIENYKIDPFVCEGCGACNLICPQNAIKLHNEKSADTFITGIGNDIISRAEMDIGGDNSGKLITYLRRNGKKFNKNDKLTIIDGSPGIGCSVISSITGSDAVLIVTEPTISGFEDFMRVVSLCKYFRIFTMVCINKYDINEDLSKEIENFIKKEKLFLVGRIPYDDIVMKSINELKPIIYYENSKAGDSIKKMWNSIERLIY
ncbi:ATP-binding protein [Clostridium sp. MT-14]|uniref:ATP-binding protein n=1 Tax=Clostridium aromativorans TaxID=2836848 RepID=A0ABS8N5M9_9CLOT|nr:ATP-binding protein [Clostridium aromativorans]MCC9295120.1 ATP-binding protein [Clostridium aromativorans]